MNVHNLQQRMNPKSNPCTNLKPTDMVWYGIVELSTAFQIALLIVHGLENIIFGRIMQIVGAESQSTIHVMSRGK